MDKARKKAFLLLEEILRDSKYSNLALKNGLDGFDERDRAFICALVYGTLDKLINLDYIISLYARGRIQPKIRNILRISIYQIMYMERVPDFSAVKCGVDLCENIGKGMLKGYVNGVLRSVAKNKDNIEYPKDRVGYISKKYSYPEFLVKEFILERGDTAAERFCAFDGEHETSVRVSGDDFAKTMVRHHGRHALYFDNFFYTKDMNGLTEDKACFIQSEASYAACLALSAKENDRILDACAAPGGKTVCLASIIKSGEIIACDKHPHRVELIKKNVQRAGAENTVKAVCADWTRDNDLGEFDRVLVDAPCSGLGVLGKKPEIKNTVSERGFKELENMQFSILSNAAKHLKRGGILVYSTCTVRNGENIGIVEKFLKENADFSLDSLSGLLGEKFENGKELKKGFLQLYPEIDLTDGFFIARMKKN